MWGGSVLPSSRLSVGDNENPISIDDERLARLKKVLTQVGRNLRLCQ